MKPLLNDQEAADLFGPPQTEEELRKQTRLVDNLLGYSPHTRSILIEMYGLHETWRTY